MRSVSNCIIPITFRAKMSLIGEFFDALAGSSDIIRKAANPKSCGFPAARYLSATPPSLRTRVCALYFMLVHDPTLNHLL